MITKDKINEKYKKLPQMILIFLVIIQFMMSMYCCLHKGISTDEIYSLGLANNTAENLFFSDDQITEYGNKDGWFPGEKIHDYLTVQKDERFDYVNVFQKQKADVHPPLFYLLEHTLYSFFPDEQAYMCSYIINMIAVMLITVFIFMSMKKVSENAWYALLPSAFWVFSEAAFQLVTYIRMYALLALWITLMVYIHICIMMESRERTETKEMTDSKARFEISRKRFIQLALCVMAGGLTHYYFYVCSFFIAFYYCILKFVGIAKQKQKQEKTKKCLDLIQYCCAYAFGGGAALLIFPKAVYHVLKTNVGKEVQNNLSGGESLLGGFITEWKNSVCTHVGMWIFVIMVMILLLGVIQTISDRRKLDFKQKTLIQMLFLFGLTAVSYFFLITKITIYVAWYYISPVFMLSQFVIFLAGCAFFKQEQRKYWYITIVFIAMISLINYLPSKVSAVKEQRQLDISKQQMIEQITGDDCIYISKSWNNLYGNRLPDMAYMDEIKCITIEDLMQTEVENLLIGRNSTEQKVVLMIRGDENFDICIDYIQQTTGRSVSELMIDGNNATYILE